MKSTTTNANRMASLLELKELRDIQLKESEIKFWKKARACLRTGTISINPSAIGTAHITIAASLSSTNTTTPQTTLPQHPQPPQPRPPPQAIFKSNK
jgi:hypothetical protein